MNNMPQLKRKKDDSLVLPQMREAQSLFSRMKGLLGTQDLPLGHGLWIHRCNSIHTFFMNYAIDCIFLDSEMRVVSTVANVRPGRLVFPQLGAQSVVEIASGQVLNLNLKVGEELYVGD